MSQGEKVELLFQQIHRNVISFKNVDNIGELPNNQGNIKINTIQKITVCDLSFGYGKSSLFENLDVEMQRGDFILLKGKNGTGKSTLIQLLLNQLTPNSGKILIDGKDLNELSINSYYSQVAYVNQHEPVFDDSIKSYLEIISKRTIRNEEIESIKTKFQLEYINEIHEDRLSGGEKKKLLLMKLKALEDKASLIILDELDAELDSSTKKIYISYLNELASRGDKIILVIQHSPTNDLQFNKVIELK